MHPSAISATQSLVDSYIPTNASLTVLDVGSRQVAGQKTSHRQLFDPDLCRYIGVDVTDGPNVDVVLDKPYRLPFDDDSMDVIVCGQVFEHIPFFWVTALEFARVVRTDGFIILSAPSRGHVHNPPFDGWRFYEQGFDALADFCDLRCVETATNFPPIDPETGRHDLSNIPSTGYTDAYWGDTVGIFQKTHLHDARSIAAIREPLVDWANLISESSTTRSSPPVHRSTLRRAGGRVKRTLIGAKQNLLG